MGCSLGRQSIPTADGLTLPTLAPVTAHSVDTVLTTTGLSSAAFIHICPASISQPSHRAAAAACTDAILSIPAWRPACCWSTSPRKPACPLPTRAAGRVRPGGSGPRAVEISCLVDGLVGAAGSVSIASGKKKKKKKRLIYKLHAAQMTPRQGPQKPLWHTLCGLDL